MKNNHASNINSNCCNCFKTGLYRCKDVESFGSGLKIIYSVCSNQNVLVSYHNQDNYFCLALSRVDRNITPNNVKSGGINGGTNELETAVLGILMKNGNAMVSEISDALGKSHKDCKPPFCGFKGKTDDRTG